MSTRVNVLGVGISVLNLQSALTAVIAAVQSRRRGYICVTGVHGVMEAQTDPALKRILNEAFLCTPDGMPMVWAGRLAGHREMGRVYGPDLMLAICEWSQKSGARHFFYGGGPGVAEELAQKLQTRFPGLTVAGTYTPPFRPLTGAELTDLQSRLSASRPDFFWVGLSTPKQERFMAEYLPQLDVPLMLGVGVAFKIYFVMAWRSGQTGLLHSSLTHAVLFSAATTATAFGSLWLSHHPGTSSMGKLLALSLCCTLIGAVVFQPVLMGKPRVSRRARSQLQGIDQ